MLAVTNCLLEYCIYCLSCAAVLTVNKDDLNLWTKLQLDHWSAGVKLRLVVFDIVSMYSEL